MAFNTEKSISKVQFAGYASMLLMIGILGSWAVLAQLNGAVIADATVVPESFSKKIQHRDGGVVQKILVRDGDTVKTGQDLVLVDPTETRAELGIVQGLLDESRVRRVRLDAQRESSRKMKLPADLVQRANDENLKQIVAGQTNLLISTLDAAQGKRDQFATQIDQLNEQIAGIDAQIDAKQKQLSLINDELKGLRSLRNQGLVQLNRVLSMERELASLLGQEGELRASRAAALGRIGEIKIEIIQIDEQIRNQALTELRETEAKVAELQERLVSAEARLKRMSITSPADGIVYQMAVHTEGGVIAPGETLMLLIPQGDDLVLQAQVRPQDVDQVVEGQAAQIRFPGFNARTTPEVAGEVVQVAADTTKIDNQTPPFYAVRLRISADELKKLGVNKLRPGMNAQAFIQTESQSPLQYLVRPLIEQIKYAMTET
jgi:HlyD family secretion protein